MWQRSPQLRTYHDRFGGVSLFLVTAAIFFAYFHGIILNLNSVMSSITADSLKNYYTFCYHASHDASPWHFGGMQHPFGEHVVYTDCQPLLSNLLRLLPFLHGYEVGLLHALIYISFCVTPVILRRIFLALEVHPLSSWFCALGIGLLSPQFVKLNAGHFALAYTFIIPLAILWTIRFLQSGKMKFVAILSIYNTLLFFLHPYLGFGLSVFSASSLLLSLRKAGFVKKLSAVLLTGILPLVFFKIFMHFTDRHPDRPVEPFGLGFMVENAGSLLVPEFGPFKNILARIFPAPTGHYEGHSYVGFAIILLAAISAVLLFTKHRNLFFSRVALIILASGFLLLLVSFGYHHALLRTFGIQSPAVNQFRAVSRFAWFFYYALAIFLVASLDRLPALSKHVRSIAVAVFTVLSLVEAHYYLTRDQDVFWKWRNLFNENQLSEEEKSALELIRSGSYQCIAALPVVHIGSEMMERTGGYPSLIPATVLSYHSGLPMIGIMASRTSISESETALGVLDPAKAAHAKLGSGSLFVIRSADSLMPDEHRLWHKSRLLFGGDSIRYGAVSPSLLFKWERDSLLTISCNSAAADSSRQILFMRDGRSEAFDVRIHRSYESILQLPAGKLDKGRYVLSFRYYSKGQDFRALSCILVLARDSAGAHEWLQQIPIRFLSGFYPGYRIFEHYITIDADKGYNLFLFGTDDVPYHISHLMVRPAELNVGCEDGSALNNFPLTAAKEDHP